MLLSGVRINNILDRSSATGPTFGGDNFARAFGVVRV
jgi:hypothetical protein